MQPFIDDTQQEEFIKKSWEDYRKAQKNEPAETAVMDEGWEEELENYAKHASKIVAKAKAKKSAPTETAVMDEGWEEKLEEVRKMGEAIKAEAKVQQPAKETKKK